MQQRHLTGNCVEVCPVEAIK
ncbi:4Fe-4S binding protein [Sporosarcina aquimarina]